MADALALLNEVASALVDFEFRHGTMDEVFLALTHQDSVNGEAAL
jgi:hypothetical protein